MIPDDVTYIGPSSFSGCYSLSSIIIPEKVTEIGSSAFSGCSSLTEITIPEGVTSLGYAAFNNCSSLATVNFNPVNCSSDLDLTGKYETSLNLYPTFGRCPVLTRLNIGENVTNLPAALFALCTSLKEIYSYATVPPTCNSETYTIYTDFNTPPTTANEPFSTFDSDIYETCWLVVPEDYATAYEDDSATEWKDFTYMREITVTVPILTEECYATRYSKYSYTLEPDVKGGIITGVADDGDLAISWLYNGNNPENSEVPAETAILVKGPATSMNTDIVNYTTPTEYDTEGATSGNKLHGTTQKNINTFYAWDKDTDTAVTTDNDSYYFYKLSYYQEDGSEDKTLGFYWGAESGGPFSVPEDGTKLAWLALSKTEAGDADDSGNGAKSAFFPLGDEDGTTGIKTVPAAAAPTSGNGTDVIYNLQGVKVNDMSRKGVYIVNGRKVIKK